MTIKVFLKYTTDGKITGQTFEEDIYFEQRKARGDLVLEIPSQINYKTHKIDLDTMTVIPKTPEEIEEDRPKPIDTPQFILVPVNNGAQQ